MRPFAVAGRQLEIIFVDSDRILEVDLDDEDPAAASVLLDAIDEDDPAAAEHLLRTGATGRVNRRA